MGATDSSVYLLERTTVKVASERAACECKSVGVPLVVACPSLGRLKAWATWGGSMTPCGCWVKTGEESQRCSHGIPTWRSLLVTQIDSFEAVVK